MQVNVWQRVLIRTILHAVIDPGQHDFSEIEVLADPHSAKVKELLVLAAD